MVPTITLAQITPDKWLGQDVRMKLEALWRLEGCTQAELANLVDAPNFDHYGPTSAEESDAGAAWFGKFTVGWNDQSTGLHRYSWPEASRLAKIVKFLIENELMTLVEIHAHLGLHQNAVERIKSRGYDQFKGAEFATGRIRGMFVGSEMTTDTITHEVMIALWLAGEELSRARRVRVISTRDDDESEADFRSRANALCYDDFTMEDCWIAIGHNEGILFSEEGPDNQVSSLIWDKKNKAKNTQMQFSQKNRVQSFDLIHSSEGPAMSFTICNDPASVKFGQDILRSVSRFTAR